MLKSTAGDTLRHARWAKDIAIEALAKEAGVSPATIIKLERGEQVRGQVVYKVAPLLDLDPKDLFTEEVSA